MSGSLNHYPLWWRLLQLRSRCLSNVLQSLNFPALFWKYPHVSNLYQFETSISGTFFCDNNPPSQPFRKPQTQSIDRCTIPAVPKFHTTITMHLNFNVFFFLWFLRFCSTSLHPSSSSRPQIYSIIIEHQQHDDPARRVEGESSRRIKRNTTHQTCNATKLTEKKNQRKFVEQ